MQAGTRHDRAQRGGLAVSANEAAVQVGIMHYSCRKQDAYLEGVDSIIWSRPAVAWLVLHAASVVLYCCMPAHRPAAVVGTSYCMLPTTVMNRS